MKAMLSATLIVLMAAVAGYGQPQSLKLTVDFPFMVEGKALPAGSYDFVRDETATAFRVTDGGKNSFYIPVITRIAGPRNEIPRDAYVVFDVVGGKTFLSEIWIPGDDGYLMSTTKEKHEHKTVTVKR
jgi:hypothetical protein